MCFEDFLGLVSNQGDMLSPDLNELQLTVKNRPTQ